ncbi:hypothetical protein [Paenibacillus sp. NPDC057967]|uniref:hypothetical protein n=1 Tax=Paenibacillus sp. NPDC057967 TaxID=3346293 RepID=UPI0036DE7AAB
MDKKAKKILMQTFWTSQGWRSSHAPFAGEDFEYAKGQGLMFDPLTITHDELIHKLKELQVVIPKERVAAAFLHSLSTRKVHLRSALSSWALTADLPLHAYGEQSVALPSYSSCGHCDSSRLMSDADYTNADLNVLNFERVKWGGVRLNHLLYCWLDLELLSREEETAVSEQDLIILKDILQAVEACREQDGPRMLEKRWKEVLPSSKNERDMLLEVLGFAGVLAAKDTPRARKGRDSDFVSMAIWQGSDGYSRESAKHFFGGFM